MELLGEQNKSLAETQRRKVRIKNLGEQNKSLAKTQSRKVRIKTLATSRLGEQNSLSKPQSEDK